MKDPSQDKWSQIWAICEDLKSMSPSARGDRMNAYREDGVDPSVLSLVRVELGLPSVEPLPEPGDVIGGRYTLQERIGEGGMGLVFRADDQVYPDKIQPIVRKVALKFIRPEFAKGEATASERFQKEIAILCRLSHPGIARIFEGGMHQWGTPRRNAQTSFFSMELVQGEAITQHVERQNLSIRERLALFRQACQAIGYAHQEGVLHLDLKPAHILVERDRTVRLIDFGLAHQLDPEGIDPMRRMYVGTPAYMAPEQVSGSYGQIDRRTDIFSLGVILFELIEGHRPYSVPGIPFTAICQAILEAQPTRLEGSLGQVIAKALEKDPARRFLSVEEFDDEVERLLEPGILQPTPSAQDSSAMIQPSGPLGWLLRAGDSFSVALFVFSSLIVAFAAQLGILWTFRGFAEPNQDNPAAYRGLLSELHWGLLLFGTPLATPVFRRLYQHFCVAVRSLKRSDDWVKTRSHEGEDQFQIRWNRASWAVPVLCLFAIATTEGRDWASPFLSQPVWGDRCWALAIRSPCHPPLPLPTDPNAIDDRAWRQAVSHSVNPEAGTRLLLFGFNTLVFLVETVALAFACWVALTSFHFADAYFTASPKTRKRVRAAQNLHQYTFSYLATVNLILVIVIVSVAWNAFVSETGPDSGVALVAILTLGLPIAPTLVLISQAFELSGNPNLFSQAPTTGVLSTAWILLGSSWTLCFITLALIFLNG